MGQNISTLMRCALVFAVPGILLSCSDSGGSSPVLPPAPAPINSAPTFSTAPTFTVDENALGEILTVSANDTDGIITSLTMTASADASLFDFDGSTGALSLSSRLAFDTPEDADTNNVYDLTFQAQDDDGATATLDVAITLEEALLKARLPPSGNFELVDWRLDQPVNSSGDLTGLAAIESETSLASGFESEYFFTGPDGGLVMVSPVVGATTQGSSFSRTELREMLRRENSSIRARPTDDIPNGNNWAFSSQPAAAQANAGGIDGTLRVTLAVNAVTTTGASNQIGRLIIGQIHAKDDEPVRLYYRILPGNQNGSIYAEHEISGGDDIRFEVIGDSSSSASNPFDGIPLNERFTYEIIAVGNLITVVIYDENNMMLASRDIDISASGYDVLDDWMYFKAGNYHVNSTADPSEFSQITLYELTNTHIGYAF